MDDVDLMNNPTTRVFLICAAIVIVLAGLKAATVIVVPFLLSAFIAIACNPLILRLARYGTPKWLSIIVIILLILVFGFMLAGLVTQSMNDFRVNLPSYEAQLTNQFTWILDQLSRLNIEVNRQLVTSNLDPGVAMSVATNFLSGMGGVLSNFLLILMTVVFMLAESRSMNERLHVALGDKDGKLPHLDRFIHSVNQYLAMKTLVSLGTGGLVFVWLTVFNIDHILLWTTVAFLLNFIPTIGSIIAALPAVAMALLQYDPATAGAVALGYVVINTLMGNVIEPKVMGKGLGLSTLVVFLSLIFWGWLLGSVGMLLSVPLTMVVKIALDSNRETAWLGSLLGNGERTGNAIMTLPEHSK